MELAIQVRKMRRSPRGRARVLVDYPIYYLTIPEGKRDRRCSLTSDTCTIDDQYFLVRGCLELPVRDESDPFIWGVWVSDEPISRRSILWMASVAHSRLPGDCRAEDARASAQWTGLDHSSSSSRPITLSRLSNVLALTGPALFSCTNRRCLRSRRATSVIELRHQATASTG